MKSLKCSEYSNGHCRLNPSGLCDKTQEILGEIAEPDIQEVTRIDMIKALLQRLMGGISSNSGGNAQAAMWGLFAVMVPVISGFASEEYRLGAFVVFCVAMAVINWRTKGSGLAPEDGAELRTRFLEPSDDEVAEALRRVRGND